MQEVVLVIISALIMSLADIYNLTKINKYKAKKINLIFAYLFISFAIIVSSFFGPSLAKPFIMLFTFGIVSKIIFKTTIKGATIDCFYLEFICILGEAIFVVALELVHNNLNAVEWSKTFSGLIISNLCICLNMIVLVNIKLIKKIHELLISITDSIKIHKVVFIILFSFITLISLFYVVYYKYYTNHLALYLVILLIFLFYSAVLITTLYYNNSYNKVKDKYSVSLENLVEYEELIDQYRVINHENRNQLLIIRNIGSYKKAKEYIDSLLNSKESESKNLFYKVRRIPSRYLRVVIYNKMKKMEDNHINSELIIGRKVTTNCFKKISDKEMVDICNVVNVFLDNAIEAAIESTKKNILIDISVDNELCISISNTYYHDFDLSKLGNAGYSSKGKNHGYGLKLVKSIIEKNRNISNETEKTNEIFTQILKIKM